MMSCGFSDSPPHLKQHHFTLPEAADLAQNRPLWRMMSTYGATQSWVACQKRRRRRSPCRMQRRDLRQWPHYCTADLALADCSQAHELTQCGSVGPQLSAPFCVADVCIPVVTLPRRRQLRFAGILTMSTQFAIWRVCGACDWLLAHYEY